MFIFHKRCALSANLPWRHHTCSSPCSPPFRVADPTPVSCQDLPHGPVGPFLLLLPDRFHSVTAPAYFYSKCHFSNLQWHALPSRILSSIKPVYPEQTVDIYLWSTAASQLNY
ncbi:unnamed protein product [Protopolystoma xenopodis]|uniref:Uncharacterized protein n=1 Tax=Protopolystoma xenopodis TaxID=117903 RepID=A0A3S5AIQ6_9PLAT|nr:unnamed protein product [Protopolystoma xenopodis]